MVHVEMRRSLRLFELGANVEGRECKWPTRIGGRLCTRCHTQCRQQRPPGNKRHGPIGSSRKVQQIGEYERFAQCAALRSSSSVAPFSNKESSGCTSAARDSARRCKTRHIARRVPFLLKCRRMSAPATLAPVEFSRALFVTISLIPARVIILMWKNVHMSCRRLIL
jgi:hypothetical protein